MALAFLKGRLFLDASSPARRQEPLVRSGDLTVNSFRPFVVMGSVILVVATLVGALGNTLFGGWGLLIGFVAGGVSAWWVGRRIFDE